MSFRWHEWEIVYEMKSTTVTDLDRLVELGYDRDNARRALKLTHGDMIEAKSILDGKAKSNDKRDVNSWRQETKGDFKAGIHYSARNLERAENRALIKTPLYCSVGEPRVRDGVTFYSVNAICKTGVKVTRLRRFSSFSEFKTRLPLGTCNAFTSTFPLATPPLIGNIASIFGGESITETRRAALDEWLREFTTNEDIMTSNQPLKAKARQLLYTFLAIDQETHSLLDEGQDLWANGSTTNPFAMTSNITSNEPTPSVADPNELPKHLHGPASKYIPNNGPLTFSTDSEKAVDSLIDISRIATLEHSPCSMDLLVAKLPFKTAVSTTTLALLSKKIDESEQVTSVPATKTSFLMRIWR